MSSPASGNNPSLQPRGELPRDGVRGGSSMGMERSRAGGGAKTTDDDDCVDRMRAKQRFQHLQLHFKSRRCCRATLTLTNNYYIIIIYNIYLSIILGTLLPI